MVLCFFPCCLHLEIHHHHLSILISHNYYDSTPFSAQVRFDKKYISLHHPPSKMTYLPKSAINSKRPIIILAATHIINHHFSQHHAASECSQNAFQGRAQVTANRVCNLKKYIPLQQCTRNVSHRLPQRSHKQPPRSAPNGKHFTYSRTRISTNRLPWGLAPEG